MKRVTLMAVGMCLLASPATVALDQNLPAYKPVSGVSGRFKSVGSDTLGNAMGLWLRAFVSSIQTPRSRSRTKGRPPRLPHYLRGLRSLGRCRGRGHRAKFEAFEKKYGYKVSYVSGGWMPSRFTSTKKIRSAVCRSNRWTKSFSLNCKGSGGKSIRTWGDAGLAGEWASKSIALYGRNDISGTHEFFKEIVLYGGDFKPEVKQQPGSEAVVNNVAGDKFAIGYSGIGYRTEGVRAVPLSLTTGREFLRHVGRSHLFRQLSDRTVPLYLFQQKAERTNRSAARRVHQVCAFQGGQALTEKSGFYPLPSEIQAKELRG